MIIVNDRERIQTCNMTAKQIGSRIGIRSAMIGVGIAYLIMAILLGLDNGAEGVLWIFEVDYWPNLLLGATGLILMSHLFGQRAGIEIIERKKGYRWVGIKYGFIILITATLIGSTLGFLQEGLDRIGTVDNPFEDYYFKPLLWVTIFGIIPVIIVGVWFGWQIKKKWKSEMSKHEKEV